MSDLILSRDDDNLAAWKTFQGEFVCQWNDDAINDYPEDITSFRDIGDLVLTVWSKANSINEQGLSKLRDQLTQRDEAIKVMREALEFAQGYDGDYLSTRTEIILNGVKHHCKEALAQAEQILGGEDG